MTNDRHLVPQNVEVNLAVMWDGIFLLKSIRTKGVLKVISSAFTAEKGEICLNYIVLVFSVFLCTSQSTPQPPPRPGDIWGFSGALSPYWQLLDHMSPQYVWDLRVLSFWNTSFHYQFFLIPPKNSYSNQATQKNACHFHTPQKSWN